MNPFFSGLNFPMFNSQILVYRNLFPSNPIIPSNPGFNFASVSTWSITPPETPDDSKLETDSLAAASAQVHQNLHDGIPSEQYPPSSYQWNMNPLSVASSTSNQSSSGLPTPIDSSVQTPKNPNQHENTLTTSGVQCLWETDGRICMDWCQNPEELAGHLNEVHIPRETKVVCYWTNCDRAGKPFKKRSELVNHVRVHTGETPFQCDVCRRRFARAQNLQLHRRSHTGEKRFVCPVEGCSKRYACSSSLSKHKITHIERATVHCKQCDWKCTQSSSLEWHIKKYHPSIVPAPTPCAQSLETASFQINF